MFAKIVDEATQEAVLETQKVLLLVRYAHGLNESGEPSPENSQLVTMRLARALFLHTGYQTAKDDGTPPDPDKSRAKILETVDVLYNHTVSFQKQMISEALAAASPENTTKQ